MGTRRQSTIKGVEYDLDIQCEKSPHDHPHQAVRPLFKYVDETVFQKPTFQSFIALLDNYTASLGVAESYTQQEAAEMERFLAVVMDTACMRYTYEWLTRKKKLPAQQDKFVAAVYSAWFDLYRRKVKNDSSGFEHVFLGERDNAKRCLGCTIGYSFTLRKRRDSLTIRARFAKSNATPTRSSSLLFNSNGTVRRSSSQVH